MNDTEETAAVEGVVGAGEWKAWWPSCGGFQQADRRFDLIQSDISGMDVGSINCHGKETMRYQITKRKKTTTKTRDGAEDAPKKQATEVGGRDGSWVLV